MVIVDVVYIGIWDPFDGGSDKLIPGGVEDGRRQVVPTSGVWVGHGLGSEDGGIQGDVGDVV